MHSLYRQHQYHLGLVLGFGALLWNGTYNALAKGLTPFLSPVSLLLLSESLTALFILMTFGLVPLLREVRKMDAQTIRMSIVVGLFCSVLGPLLFFTGLARTSAINASILSSADIICILIAARCLLGERLSRIQVLGGTIVMVGVLVVNFASGGEATSVHAGDFFIVASSIFFGMGSVLFKKYLSHVMPELAILIRNLGAILTISFVMVFIHGPFVEEVTSFPMHKVLLLLAFAFFSRYLNLTFFYEALDRLSATTLALINVASPMVGIFFAVLILGEEIHSNQILGCTFIIFGLVLEQVSVSTLSSIHTHSSFFHLPSRIRRSVNGAIGMMPKNV